MPAIGNKLYLEFSHFDLEHAGEEDDTDTDMNCFDYITIEELDDDNNAVSSHKYCSKTPKPVETKKKLLIK